MRGSVIIHESSVVGGGGGGKIFDACSCSIVFILIYPGNYIKNKEKDHLELHYAYFVLTWQISFLLSITCTFCAVYK